MEKKLSKEKPTVVQNLCGSKTCCAHSSDSCAVRGAQAFVLRRVGSARKARAQGVRTRSRAQTRAQPSHAVRTTAHSPLRTRPAHKARAQLQEASVHKETRTRPTLVCTRFFFPCNTVYIYRERESCLSLSPSLLKSAWFSFVFNWEGNWPSPYPWKKNMKTGV